MKGYWVFSIMFLGIVLFSITAYAQTSTIPDWIKNNAKWWSEGQIGESDYISSLQYLISQGIIKIPITEVTATKVSLSEDDRAQSFVVHFSGGDLFTETLTIYTYSQFLHLSEAIAGQNRLTGGQVNITPQFVLSSLPSTDKQPIYNLVNKYVSQTAPPQPFFVQVDVIAGDGSIIQTWDYRKCHVLDYSTYLDDDADNFRFGERQEAEIRDIMVIECAGFSLLT